MKAEIALSLSFFLLITSCSQEKKQQKVDWNQYPVEKLSDPKKIVIPERDFEAEQQFNLINDCYFFCTTTFSDTGELYLYRLDNDTLKWQSLITQKGEGPLEMSGNSRVCSTKEGDLVLFSTEYKTKIFTLPKERIADISVLSNWQRHITSSRIGYIDKMVPIDTTRFLLTTVGDVSSMFATYQLGDTALTFIPCTYPDDEFKNVSRSMMYYGDVTKHPAKEKYFYKCASGRYMYVFDLKDGRMENISYLYNEPPIYTLAKDGVNVNEADNSFLGGDFYVTEKYIYVKVINFTLKDFGKEHDRNNGYDCWFTNQIFVFDWSGNPVKSYSLDTYISDFAVDSKDQLLYAVTKNVETDDVSLIKYHLK